MLLWACIFGHDTELCLLQGRCGHRCSRSGCLSQLHAALHTVPELKVVCVQKQTLQTWAQACRDLRTSGMPPQHTQLLQSWDTCTLDAAACSPSDMLPQRPQLLPKHICMRRCCLQSE